MSRLIILLCIVGAGLSVLIGWFSAPLDLVADISPVRSSPNVPQLERPGVTYLASANALLAQHPPPPPPKPPPAPPKPKPPPPPDVAVVLKGAVSAVVEDRSGKISLVLRISAPDPHTEVLHVGDMFMDGWKLTELTRRNAVLTRHGEIRRVAFY